MQFETLTESSILAGTDAVEHSSIAKNWTTDMQQSFPYQHKNLLEDAMDTIFKLSCALKEETKNEMSTSSSFWVTIFFLSIFAFIVLVSLGLSCFVFIVSIIVTAYALVQHFMSYVDGYVENVVISAFDDCDILDNLFFNRFSISKEFLKLAILFRKEGIFLKSDKILSSSLSPGYLFSLMGVIDAIPNEWRSIIKTNPYCAPSTLDQTCFVLTIAGKTIDLANVTSKLVYREFRSVKQTTASAKAKILSKYPDLSIDWKRLYSLAFETTLDTKLREFQYKL